MTTMAGIEAAEAAGAPAVATVRDYWPVCYWSDLLRTRDGLELCPACTAANMTQCIRPRAGAAWPIALPMIPSMRKNLAAKRTPGSREPTPSSRSARGSRRIFARARRNWRERGSTSFRIR